MTVSSNTKLPRLRIILPETKNYVSKLVTLGSPTYRQANLEASTPEEHTHLTDSASTGVISRPQMNSRTPNMPKPSHSAQANPDAPPNPPMQVKHKFNVLNKAIPPEDQELQQEQGTRTAATEDNYETDRLRTTTPIN